MIKTLLLMVQNMWGRVFGLVAVSNKVKKVATQKITQKYDNQEAIKKRWK